jgi:hypothetical protein
VKTTLCSLMEAGERKEGEGADSAGTGVVVSATVVRVAPSNWYSPLCHAA